MASLLFLILPLLTFAQTDPLKDFCRRFGHASAVIDEKLFIDGGLLNWNPISSNSLNYSNPYLLYNDLDVSNQGMPDLYSNLSINSTIPSTAGGILWPDTVNKVFYQFGGEFQTPPLPFDALYSYDALLNQWNQTSVPQDLNRIAYGAGTVVQDRAEGYYYGGWMSNTTMPGWDGEEVATNSLLRYDMIGNAFYNNSGPDEKGRAEGAMVYIPASDSGMLVYFGGVVDAGVNGSLSVAPMGEVYIYDILSNNWYTQTAGGDVPAGRRRFCAGATWPDDQSSYNIYLYGGLGTDTDGSLGFDDVYILSLPSFTWIKWWPTSPGAGHPHHSMTCNVINRSQMLIIGGTFPSNNDTNYCDAIDVYGTHNLNLGANGPNKSMWDKFYPNITGYSVPPEVVKKIGGGPAGAATATTPVVGSWANRDLPVYFSRKASRTSRTATRLIPEATSAPQKHGGLVGGKRTGVIVGAVLGGLIFLAALLGLVLLCLKRVKRKRKTEKLAEMSGEGTAQELFYDPNKPYEMGQNPIAPAPAPSGVYPIDPYYAEHPAGTGRANGRAEMS